MDIKEKTFQETLEDLDSEYSEKECTLLDVENIGKRMIGALPKLNFNKYRSEMDKMHVRVYENPTTFQLTESMAQVQAYKNRLAELITLIDHEYMIRKRVNDILFDATQFVSKQSSADKRKGEATLRFPMLLLKFTSVESFRSEVNNKINNMKAIGDTLSRQATLMQMQITLGEYRKKTTDEFKHNSEAEDELDYKSGVTEIDWKDA